MVTTPINIEGIQGLPNIFCELARPGRHIAGS